MWKIIDLDIDGSLTGDTGVWEVAWVNMPAIEQELIFFGRQKFYKAPEYVATKACQAIKENEKRGNPAGTQVGKVRAQQLCNRSEISLETVKRMKSFLERAATYNTGNWDDNGTIAYGLWGGEDALTWVDKVLRSVENQEMAEVGPRGGIRESEKAPKSDTPNPSPKGEGSAKGDASSTRGAEVTERVEEILKGKSDDFNEKYKDKLGYGVNVGMLKSVYQRGVGAYNTSHSPAVKSSEQWALARVNAFLYLVKNGRPENSKYTTDYDLLPSGHPKKEKMMEEEFVYPSPSESKDVFISRCIEYVVKEGKTQEQAAGQCYGMWENRKFAVGDRVGFEWKVLQTSNGLNMFKNELRRASLPVLFIQGLPTQELIDFTNEYRIPVSAINMYSTRNEKVKLIQDMGLKRHYDNDLQVRNDLGSVAIRFDYVVDLPSFENTSGDTMETKPVLEPVLFQKDCNCGKEEFGLMGYIDGQPVFSTKEEAEEYGTSQLGCDGSHQHTDEDGNTVYMPCELHGDAITLGEYTFNISDGYSDEEIEATKILQKVYETSPEQFERLVGSMRGATEDEIFRRSHKTPVFYFKYERVLSGAPDRDFCDSIENRYFRRMEIDLLQDTNTEFGHNRQPYSKWLYKGGPNCVHAWRRFIFTPKDKKRDAQLKDLGMVSGTPGTPPKSMPNSGYYSEATKRKSEVAYIISQQNMGKQEVELTGELTPLYWVDGLPLYSDPIQASDASYLLGCGGVYETVQHTGQMLFQACSTNMRKQEMEKPEMFKAVEEKRMVYMPLMIPNILIPRMDETTGEKYFVRFKPETIEKIRDKFMTELRNRETNLEHSDKKFSDAVMVESWIVTSDNDKVYDLGFTKEQIPFGTWFAGYKILDTDEGNELWEKYIKTNKVRGGSVEGNFILNFSRQKTDDYLLEQIINILKQIN